MQSTLMFVFGAAALLIGMSMFARSRASRSHATVAGAVVFMLIGLAFVIGGFWSAGTLTRDDGSGG